MKLSIMELAKVTAAAEAAAALANAKSLAIAAEAWGYNRIWVAEHHNMAAIASAATQVVIGLLAGATKTIRVGAGGVMLPNHSPYIVAEQFGTLERLFPGRIDLGVGRAPGTDQATLLALRRRSSSVDTFPEDVQELQSYFAPLRDGQHVAAYPAAGTMVPIWMLSSSPNGAYLAAEMGLPYAFASQFSPNHLDAAISVYRANFKPSAQLQRPYVMAGVNLVAAESDAEAEFISTTAKIFTTDMMRGRPRVLQPPIADISAYWTHQEAAMTNGILHFSFIGSRDKVRKGLRDFVEAHGVDEVIAVSDIYHHAHRMKSFEIAAEALDLKTPL